MGLSASQARLLSLTNRQHNVEYRAQALQHKKLRLANESDAVYSAYIDALDETTIKTYQMNSETGAVSWIDGTINNLMRNGTSEQTSGNIFYVQDIKSGKLYIPVALNISESESVNIQEALNNISGSGIEEQARSFAEQFGVVYTPYDLYENDKVNYQNAIAKGWNKAISENEDYNEVILQGYNQVVAENKNLSGDAKLLLLNMPKKDENGYYTFSSDNAAELHNYINMTKNILSNTYKTVNIQSTNENDAGIKVVTTQISPYTETQRDILQASLDLIKSIGTGLPENGQEGSYNYEYSFKSFSAKDSNENEYYTTEQNLTDLDKFNLMMNGGMLIWNGTRKMSYNDLDGYPFCSTSDYTKEYNIYENYTDLLSSAGYTSFGEAITDILTNIANSENLVSKYLSDNNITEEDISNYLKFKDIKQKYYAYLSNPKVIEYIPNNKAKAEQYEQLYKALVSCGKNNMQKSDELSDDEKIIESARNGFIICDDERTNNTTWVNNMIKNAQVIITTWDPESEVLSKTSPALNTRIREVTNQANIDKITQDYEEKLDEVNSKDKKYDIELEKLATERNAIQTEVESLEKIIKDNIDKNFKVFF